MNQFMQRYENLGQSFNPEDIKLEKSFRVNTLKISNENLLARLHVKGVKTKKIPFLKNGYYFTSPFPLSSSEEYLLGLIYLQEAASQVPVEVLLEGVDIASLSDSVIALDMCAAPGSKTTQLVQLLNDKFPVVALDDVAPRLEKLKDNILRLGLKSVLVFKKDGIYADDLNLKFDFVLLDAPCSGNFCVNNRFFEERSLLLGIKKMPKTQKQLLKTAWRVLKKGGVLVYSTCSLEPEEDELVVDWFLSEKDDAKLLSVNVSIADDGQTNIFGSELNPDIKLTKKFWPHKTHTEGFFIAKFKKI